MTERQCEGRAGGEPRPSSCREGRSDADLACRRTPCALATRLAGTWQPNAIPTTFVIDRTCAVSHRAQGYREGDLEAEVRKVL